MKNKLKKCRSILKIIIKEKKSEIKNSCKKKEKCHELLKRFLLKQQNSNNFSVMFQ
jgi:hypothetical protein